MLTMSVDMLAKIWLPIVTCFFIPNSSMCSVDHDSNHTFICAFSSPSLRPTHMSAFVCLSVTFTQNMTSEMFAEIVEGIVQMVQLQFEINNY
jgi:hypothetical protein